MTDFSINKESIVSSTKTARTLRRADVMFLLDCTGTMEDSLAAVTHTIADVVNIYSESSVQIRLGLVEYRDLTQEQDSHLHRMHLHSFKNGETFTSDTKSFTDTLTNLTAEGGGPEPESTFDAIGLAAMKADWDIKADKIMVLFSDAIPYRFGKIVDDICGVCELIRINKIDQLHFVIDRNNPKIVERFTTILRCVPDVRDPTLSIFGNTYPIYSSNKGKSSQDFKHLKKTLLNIAKTSGDQAGGNTSGSNPYASEESTRQQHISGCALERKHSGKRSRKPKPEKNALNNSHQELNDEDYSPQSNPYS